MAKNEILLSVIVPVHNAEQYIENCIESILKQKDLSLEIILVDDGSTDQSGMLCDQLSKKDKRIKALHTENGGITKARLRGAKESKGKWITFVDADDWIAEEAYKDIVEEDCEIVVTGICRYVDTLNQIRQKPYFSEGIYDKKAIESDILPIMLWTSELGYWALDPSLCTKLFKREIIIKYLEKASVVGSNYGEDSMVIFPMMLEAKHVSISNKIYYYHRQRKTDIPAPYIQDEKFFLKLYKVYQYLKGEFVKTKYWNLMKDQLDCFYILSVEKKKQCLGYPILDFSIFFPLDSIPKGSKVVLYGAGKVGRGYFEQNLEYHFCDFVSWVDMRYKDKREDGRKIDNPAIIKEMNYDYIIIAVDDYYAAKEIAVYLNSLGVKREKVVWHSVRVNHKEFEKVFHKDRERK